MPEEGNVSAQTSQTVAEPAAATQTTEPAAKAAETTTTAEPKAQEPVATETAKTEPELTLDSYKDLGTDEFKDVFTFEADGLKAFKEIGLKYKVSPEAMKELTVWSLKEAKRQQEDFKATQEQWRKENAEKYGDNLKNVKTNVGRVLAQMDKSGEFANLLKDAGAEEHPATLAFLSAIGDVLLEKGSVNPNATIQGKEMTLEDMYKPKN